MSYLIGVTVLWAFSFSLIGVYLAGVVDPYFAVFTRLTLACLLFAPVLWRQPLPVRHALGLMGVGAIQIGLMYTFFYQSFLWLSVPEILLFTIFTPIYVTLVEDLLARRWTPMYLLSAAAAVAGAGIIRYDGISQDFWTGFLIVQASNLCFAAGQVAYRHVYDRLDVRVKGWRVFGWFFVGAWPISALLWLGLGDLSGLPTTATQWGVLTWLGVVASGLGYYFWNRGATQVDIGTLAVMNNALIPAGLTVNLLIWNHDADISRLALGAAVMALALVGNRWWVVRRSQGCSSRSATRSSSS
ncbi:EamA family transporter [Salinisphaera sp. T31B1]|uniref:EamA family transporter n=1 Tax=Salinisphaera sp. T31B1 TaxID=727963 RepID=UPI0033407B19